MAPPRIAPAPHRTAGPMTLVLMGSMNTSTTANWFADSWAYQPNTAAVRFLHVAQGGPAVDVTALTTPGTNVAWKQIPFGSVGDFQTVPSSPDPLKFAIVDAARNTVGSANISSLASEQSYTVLLLGSPSRSLLSGPPVGPVEPPPSHFFQGPCRPQTSAGVCAERADAVHFTGRIWGILGQLAIFLPFHIVLHQIVTLAPPHNIVESTCTPTT